MINKQDLLDSYKKYGITEENVCKSRIGIFGNDVDEIAVIAPLHRPEAYIELGCEVTQLSFGYYPAYRIKKDDFQFTFICTQIGACNVGEIVVALAFSNCKKVIFTGSCGALKPNIEIGDIFLPEFSMCGDGAVKYFTKGNVLDNYCFGKKFYPTKDLQNCLINYMDKQTLTPYKFIKNFSIDTIVAQFLHIDEIVSMGADVVEMETALVFCVAQITNLEAVAILNVSDSTCAKKSLLGGRTKEELDRHVYTEKTLVPSLVLGFLSDLTNN